MRVFFVFAAKLLYICTMERRNFLKRLFGAIAATAATSVPTFAKKDDSTFTFEDIAFRCSGNNELFYLKKDCWLDKELNEILGKRVVDRRYFNYYDPKRDIRIPVKEKYTREDFMGIILWAKAQYDFNYYCNGTANGGVETGLCRFLFDKRENCYKTEVYSARNPKASS